MTHYYEVQIYGDDGEIAYVDSFNDLDDAKKFYDEAIRQYDKVDLLKIYEDDDAYESEAIYSNY